MNYHKKLSEVPDNCENSSSVRSLISDRILIEFSEFIINIWYTLSPTDNNLGWRVPDQGRQIRGSFVFVLSSFNIVVPISNNTRFNRSDIIAYYTAEKCKNLTFLTQNEIAGKLIHKVLETEAFEVRRIVKGIISKWHWNSGLCNTKKTEKQIEKYLIFSRIEL